MRLEGSTESGERRAGRPDHPPCFKNQVCKILAQQQPRCPGEATGLINLERAIGLGMFGEISSKPALLAGAVRTTQFPLGAHLPMHALIVAGRSSLDREIA